MLRLLAIGALCQLGLACYGSRMDGPAESRDAGPPASDGGAPDARAPDAHTRSACDDWCASRRVEEESGEADEESSEGRQTCICITPTVSHLCSGWLKLVAPWNMDCEGARAATQGEDAPRSGARPRRGRKV